MPPGDDANWRLAPKRASSGSVDSTDGVSLGEPSGAGVANARVDALARGLEVTEIVVVAPGAAGGEDGADGHAARAEPFEGFGEVSRHVGGADQPVDLLPEVPRP